MTLTNAIERNQRKMARFKRSQRILRAVRLRLFEYEDAGKLGKANRIIERCQRILEPLWKAKKQKGGSSVL